MGEAPGGAAASGVLASALWTYARTVFAPTQALRAAGVLPARTRVGNPIAPPPRAGLGPYFSKQYPRPVLLEQPTEHDHLVDEFDRMAEVYDAFVQPFSRPLFEEFLIELGPLLLPEARVLDAGCGPGRELLRVARALPAGELVGIDLASGMVNAAHRSARAHGHDHCAFFQADVGALPAAFADSFDLAYNSLAHHHYPDPPQATREIFRALRPGGLYCVIDPGPAWFNWLSAPLAKWGDPGWIGFHTPDQFRALMRDAGFGATCWTELLPGYLLVIAQKPL